MAARRASAYGGGRVRALIVAAACLVLAACGDVGLAGGGQPAEVPDPAGTSGGAGGPRPTSPTEGVLEVHFIDVGQGDATLLVTAEVAVLIDAGRHTSTDVVDYLDGQGLTAIDVVAITHPHADHIGQFDRVVERFDVAEVWWSPSTHTSETFARALAALEASDAVYEEPRAGDATEVGPLRFSFANPAPAAGDGDLHDNALALRVDYGDVTFLFTGDAEGPTEQRMLAGHAAVLDADVYQVGHHGSSSSTSAAFLAAVSPQVAVYSAGQGNSYGHPHAEVVDRLVAGDVAVYGTDVHGTIVLTTDGAEVRVDTATHAAAITTR